jgi:hypothetical protein
MCGLFFGTIPPRLLIASKCRYLDCRRLISRLGFFDVKERRLARWWKMPLVWIDPVRGYVTAWLLNQAILTTPGAKGFDRLMEMLITAALMLTVLWIQTERRKGENESTQTVSPTAFMAGMIVGILPPMAAIAALVLGVATAMAMADFSAGYGAASIAALTSVLVFTRNIPLAGLSGFLIAFPMLLSWVRRNPLVMPIRG